MKKAYLLVLSLIVVLSACTKEDDKTVKENVNEAGLGGNVEISVFPTYNGQPLWSQVDYLDSAYVKFNTLDFPGTDVNLYDLKVPSDHSNHIHVRGLKKGDYYFFVTGRDPNTGQRLVGVSPFTLSSTEGIFHLPVAVSPQQ